MTAIAIALLVLLCLGSVLAVVIALVHTRSRMFRGVNAAATESQNQEMDLTSEWREGSENVPDFYEEVLYPQDQIGSQENGGMDQEAVTKSWYEEIHPARGFGAGREEIPPDYEEVPTPQNQIGSEGKGGVDQKGATDESHYQNKERWMRRL